ncbi:MAG: hypothetical protein K2X66_02135 [Cyanobacteria bacterium]|nr:hypothetical protein [Cyanobacteriota bacterium]
MSQNPSSPDPSENQSSENPKDGKTTSSSDQLPEGVYWCSAHPSTQTRLTCTQCEEPICTKCIVICEVGMKCKKCISGMKSHVLQFTWKEVAITVASGILLGAVFGNLVHFLQIPIYGGIFNYILAFMIGQHSASWVHQWIKYKRGWALSLAIITGALVGISFTPFGAWLMDISSAMGSDLDPREANELFKTGTFLMGLGYVFHFGGLFQFRK